MKRPSRQQKRAYTGLGLVAFILLLFICLLLAIPAAQAAKSPNEPSASRPVIGIDLGTTNSAVGVFRNGNVEIIPNEQGNRITPSYVAFTESGRLVGEAAKNQLASNARNTIFDIKRLIGRNFSDKEVQQDIKNMPFTVVAGPRDNPLVQVTAPGGGGGEVRQYSPEEISAMILGKMKSIAEGYLGERVEDAVVTVPAYFNDRQRQATRDAARIAGLNVMRIVNEPTAAVLAVGLDRDHQTEERKVLVYDLGGGTFDVSLLSVDQGVFEVLATAGDTRLGGEDFDQRVMDHMAKLFANKRQRLHGSDVDSAPLSPNRLGELRREVEKAKRALSSQMAVTVTDGGHDGAEALSLTLTRAKFEELNADLFKKTFRTVEQVLRDAKVKREEVDDVVLVGGSTRIPKVRSMLEEYFGGKMASGGVDPDEAVALGAAIQAGFLSSVPDQDDYGYFGLLIDVNPLTLGIETSGGLMAEVIRRNSAIPTRKTKTFTTSADNQRVVLIKVYEGEHGLTKDNGLLGKFELRDIEPAPRGVPQIQVAFELDADGILKVIALDEASGNQESITVASDGLRLSAAEIEKMMATAENEDKTARERIESRNELEGYVSALRSKMTQRNGGLTKEEQDAISEAVNDARQPVASPERRHGLK